MAGKQWRLDMKAASMQFGPEIAERLWRVARPVKQEHRGCVRSIENKSFRAREDAVRAAGPRRLSRDGGGAQSAAVPE